MNIISTHEVLLTRSHLALSMEYAQSGSLSQYAERRWDPSWNVTGERQNVAGSDGVRFYPSSVIVLRPCERLVFHEF